MVEDFFHKESAEEKLRCAYENNRGYTRVSQEVYVLSLRWKVCAS